MDELWRGETETSDTPEPPETLGPSETRETPKSGPLVERMCETMDRHDMVRPGDRLLVAVSGGPDSSALLHALYSVRKERSFTLHVYHLDHEARGEQSAEDAEHVRRFAERMGLGCTVESRPVREEAARLGRSFQDAARAVRYDRLESVARAVRADRVALGHTADDQAETVLMRMLRGSGARGLSGIPPVRGMFIRPLIDVWRREVEAYCRHFDLRPRTDPTNATSAYVRNRIRNELIPWLEREFQPAVRANLVQTADVLRDDDRHLGDEARAAFRHLSVADGAAEGGPPYRVTIELERFHALSPALKRRVLRLAYSALRGDLKQLRKGHVDDAVRLAETGRGWEGANLTWPGDISVRLVTSPGRGRLEIALPRPARSRPGKDAESPTLTFFPEPDAASGDAVGTTTLWSGAGRLTYHWADETRGRSPARPRGLASDLSSDRSRAPMEHPASLPHMEGQSAGNMKGNAAGEGAPASPALPDWIVETELTATFDGEELRPPLWARARAGGDEFRPWGMDGTKKVNSLFRDCRVPPEWRPVVPVVGDGDGILWVAGLRRSDRAAVTEKTRRRLVITWHPPFG